jgi:uncharacterized membrane protein YeaQ/YmgE (transglycosylase-associated protein family)
MIILIVGAIAGWLAGQIVQGTGFGIVGDLIIGIVGAFIGSWVLPQLGIHLGAGIVSAIINATVGALLPDHQGCARRRRMALGLGKKLGQRLVVERGGIVKKREPAKTD